MVLEEKVKVAELHNGAMAGPSGVESYVMVLIDAHSHTVCLVDVRWERRLTVAVSGRAGAWHDKWRFCGGEVAEGGDSAISSGHQPWR